MSVIVFMFALVAVVMVMYRGYRLTMYLYSHGAVEAASQVEIGAGEFLPVQPARELMQAEAYGLRYARVGLMIVAGVFIIVLIALVTAIFSVL